MTVSVAKKFESFAAALRTRRVRPALLVLFGWLLLAQTALAVHAVDHAKVENGVPCALCMAGDHLAGTPATSIHHIPPPTPEAVASTVSGSIAVAFRAAYRSRAPPAHLPS
ncbi:MAG: hypothetical protein ABI640_06510 [Gammaproteobacteria bacterium]